MSDSSYLSLNQQLCFPVYASSRMITRLYQPLLQKLNLTYPQYLVMLVLWEEERLSVSSLCKKLYLNTNTVTPLLNKMKEKGLITKNRSSVDERTVMIASTKMGKELKVNAECIPLDLVKNLDLSVEELVQMRTLMWKFLQSFNDQ